MSVPGVVSLSQVSCRGLNNPLNGIFLHGRGVPTPGVTGAIHVGSHNGAYEKLLFGKLQDAGALGAKGDDLTVAVVNGIAEMKFCLLSGECVLNVRGVIK